MDICEETKCRVMALQKRMSWHGHLEEGVNIVSCKWVYKTKRNEKNEIARYKARLVARGFSQKRGVDFDEVFAPTARFSMIYTFPLSQGTEVRGSGKGIRQVKYS